MSREMTIIDLRLLQKVKVAEGLYPHLAGRELTVVGLNLAGTTEVGVDLDEFVRRAKGQITVMDSDGNAYTRLKPEELSPA